MTFLHIAAGSGTIMMTVVSSQAATVAATVSATVSASVESHTCIVAAMGSDNVGRREACCITSPVQQATASSCRAVAAYNLAAYASKFSLVGD